MILARISTFPTSLALLLIAVTFTRIKLIASLSPTLSQAVVALDSKMADTVIHPDTPQNAGYVQVLAVVRPGLVH